jgi:hypothetical protein
MPLIVKRPDGSTTSGNYQDIEVLKKNGYKIIGQFGKTEEELNADKMREALSKGSPDNYRKDLMTGFYASRQPATNRPAPVINGAIKSTGGDQQSSFMKALQEYTQGRNNTSQSSLSAGGNSNFDERTGRLRNAITPVQDNVNFMDLYKDYSGGNFDLMKQAAQSSTQSIVDSIKQKIAQAQQKFQPVRNQTELTKEQQLRTALESQTNTGDRGGIGRQGLLDINTAAGNQMNDTNLQEQNLLAQGSLEQQNAINNNQAELLRQLIAEQNRQEGISIDNQRYQDEQSQQDFQNNMAEAGLTGTYNGSPTLEGQQLQQQNTDKSKQEFLNTIGRFSNDYTAQKNVVANDGDTSNDWQIPYLEDAANKKRADAQAKYQEQGYVSEDIRAALGLPVGTMTAAYKDKLDKAMQAEQVKNALSIFSQTGYLTPEMATILKAYGLPTDTATLNAIKAEYSTNKPYYKPNDGGGSSTPWYLK